MSSTSTIRSAQTAARGTIISMKVAIMTAIRICIRYCRNAVSAPIWIAPASTRCAPNQSTATLETFSTSMTIGKISASSRPVRSAVAVRSALATPKRSVSYGSRTNARTTRMPVICSRSTRLTVSMRVCISRNCGTIRRMIEPERDGQHRHADQHQPGQPDVLAQRHDDAADAHDRRGDQHRAAHQHEHLHLLHVVGVAGDQRRRAEPGHLAGGEAADVAERSRRARRGRSPSRSGRRGRRRRSSRRSGPG